jgi:hypothetical protein
MAQPSSRRLVRTGGVPKPSSPAGEQATLRDDDSVMARQRMMLYSSDLASRQAGPEPERFCLASFSHSASLREGTCPGPEVLRHNNLMCRSKTEEETATSTLTRGSLQIMANVVMHTRSESLNRTRSCMMC